MLVAAFQIGCGANDSAQAENRNPAVAKPEQPASITSSGARVSVSYSGTDERGIPRYFRGNLTAEARAVLRRAFGVVAPSHLYISDSSRDGLLKYDPTPKPCATCYVNSYRIGFVSVRRPGESWEDLQRRLSRITRNSFPPSSLVTNTSIGTMDPDVQGEVGQMLDAARRARFAVHVVSTYRSPQQEAVLMHEGGGRTHTLTSLHSYGRALDVRIDDGNLGNPATRHDWIAFRRWVIRFRDDDFRILGAPDKSWDWTHVELPSAKIGFRSVDAAVEAGRECLAAGAQHACDFRPNLPGAY